MTKKFDIELEETTIEYRVVQIEASCGEEAQSIASELYKAGYDDSRSQLGQCGRRYVEFVNLREA